MQFFYHFWHSIITNFSVFIIINNIVIDGCGHYFIGTFFKEEEERNNWLDVGDRFPLFEHIWYLQRSLP